MFVCILNMLWLTSFLSSHAIEGKAADTMSLHVSAMLYVSHFCLCDLMQLTRPCCVKTDLHYTDVYTLHFGTPSKDHDF